MKFIFEAKAGFFGQYGWKRISFWRYLWMSPNYVTRAYFCIAYPSNKKAGGD